MKSRPSSQQFFLIAGLALIGFSGGYVINNERGAPPVSDSASGKQAAYSGNARSLTASTAETSFVKLDSNNNLGEYGLDSEGRRVFTGARDVSVLQRLSDLHMLDVVGTVELMGQISQMNDEELAAAWEEFCQNEPDRGMGSQLLAVHVATRLRAAGMEVQLPRGWGRAEKYLATAFIIDEVRRDPKAFQEGLLAGEELSFHQRKAMFQALAAENPSEAAQLWIENSSSEQLLREGQDLAFLMLNPESRGEIYNLLANQEGPEYDRALLATSLGYEWAMKDPDGYEEWLETILPRIIICKIAE